MASDPVESLSALLLSANLTNQRGIYSCSFIILKHRTHRRGKLLWSIKHNPLRLRLVNCCSVVLVCVIFVSLWK